ncbi:MAG: Gldg family protein [Clostridia bacterium]|nr:Gldg family protein [Clostridia bacterium]
MKKILEKLGAWFAGRSAAAIAMTALIVAILVVVNAVVYALTDAFSLYLYAPPKEEEPLSGNADRLLERIIGEGEEVSIIFLTSKDNMEGHTTGSMVLETALALDEEYDFINVRFVNFYTELDQDGNPVDLTKYQKDMKGNEVSLHQNAVVFESEYGYRVLNSVYNGVGYADFYTLNSSGYITSYNGEEVMVSMLSWVMTNEHKTAYFTQNHGETADAAFVNLLASAGYYVDVINLRQKEVPEDAALLIISGPTSDFEKGAEGSTVRVRAEIERMEDYLKRGGDLLVQLDPLVKELPVLESFLLDKGFAISAKRDENGRLIRDMVKDDVDAITTDGYTFVATHADGYVSESIHSNISGFGSGRVLMSDVACLELSKGAQPLLLSSSTSTLYAGGKQTASGGSYPVVAFNELPSSESGNMTRITVVASIYLTASQALITGGYSNKDFTYSILDELYDAPCAPYGMKGLLYSSTILENFTMGTARLIFACLMAIPVALGIIGAVIIIRRRNR